MPRNYNRTEIYYVPLKRNEFFESQSYKNFKKIIRSKGSVTAMINYMDLIHISMQDRGVIKLEPELYLDISEQAAALLERPIEEVKIDLIIMKAAGLIQLTKNSLLVIICEDVATRSIGAITRDNQRKSKRPVDVPTEQDADHVPF